MKKILDYSFKNPELLDEALTHPSLAIRSKSKGKMQYNYERLEFLGDAVLALLISEMLLSRYPDAKEGELASRRSLLISGATISLLAQDLGLGDYLYLSPSEDIAGGRENASNLENAFEAIIGAIYLDGGLDSVRSVVLENWKELIENAKEPVKDPKTELQEWAQGLGKPIPTYTLVETSGPAHSPVFTIEACVEGYNPKSATATSKKKAEKEAALALLKDVRN